MHLSVVIACRDRARRLDAVLARWLAAGPPSGCEILVVDASSHDEGGRSICGAFRGRYPRFPLLYSRLQPGASFAQCAHAGTASALGDSVALLDLDSELHDTLPPLAELMRLSTGGRTVCSIAAERDGGVRFLIAPRVRLIASDGLDARLPSVAAQFLDAAARLHQPNAGVSGARADQIPRAAVHVAPPDAALGTVVLEAGADVDALALKLERALFGRGAAVRRVLIACLDSQREEVEARLRERFRALSIESFTTWGEETLARLSAAVTSGRVGLLPAASPFTNPAWEEVPDEGPSVVPWVPLANLPETGGHDHAYLASGWLAPAALLRVAKAVPGRFPGLPQLAAAMGASVRFRSAASGAAPRHPRGARGRSPITTDAAVLAVVPHYRCEEWLGQCLAALVAQTRPLQAIVVIDDGSSTPPVELVRQFPSVTLLRAPDNVGPYRLIQSVIAQTHYDAYLFQDADDWSCVDRLELLLAEAERTGAEMIGTQALQVRDDHSVVPRCYPLDVTHALSIAPTYALLHPSSLVARGLVQRLGGFSSGLRFGGDAEFQFRAAHAARLVNIDRFAYCRRLRHASLTSAPGTGLTSSARADLDRQLLERVQGNLVRVAQGLHPDLTPLATAADILLEHLTGPQLAWGEHDTGPRAAPRSDAATQGDSADTRRYCARRLVQFPAGDDETLVLSRSGAVSLLSQDVAANLAGWRSLVRRNQQPGAKRLSDTLADSSSMVWRDYLMSDEELVAMAQAAGADPLGPPPRIATIGVVTRDRLDSLLRCVASFGTHARTHGRAPDYSVVDDTGDPAARERTRRQLHNLARTQDMSVYYAGFEEKRAFADALIATGAASADVIDLALFDPFGVGHTTGANRNAFLLDTVGQLAFSADDDTVCTVHSACAPADSLLLSSARSHLRFWFHPHHEEILRATAGEQTDLLGAHEALLGKSVTSCIARVRPEDLQCDRMGERLTRAVEACRGRVVATLNGVFGDCGLPSPAVYPLLEDDSRDRLVRTRSHYEQACSSRELLRVVTEPTISDAPWGCQTVTMGVDNRLLLPPFFPVLRGQDFLFGLTIAACYEDGFLGYVPHAVLHQPAEHRSFSRSEIWTSAAHLNLASIVAACLSSARFGVARRSPAERLAVLGAWLIELGSLPIEEFETWLREQIYRTQSAYIEMVEDLRERYVRRPAYWDHDLARQLTTLRAALARADFIVPADLVQSGDTEAARRLTPRLLHRYGELLAGWPGIVEAARALRHQGTRLSRKLA